MKHILSLLAVAMLAIPSFAQTAVELAKQQRQPNEVVDKVLGSAIVKGPMVFLSMADTSKRVSLFRVL